MSEELTESQKRIYNTHLSVSRGLQGKPFKYRKNFEKLEERTAQLLKKLDTFFKTYDHIDQRDFFTAPYKIYPDSSYYDLEYFSTRKAIKAYSQYIKTLELLDPDNSESLIRLKDGLVFVYNFCKEKGLTMDQYELYIEETLPCYIEHLKMHKINYYTLHALTFSAPKIESRVLDFIFGDFYTTFQKTKNKFFTSKKMKEFSKEATKRLNNKLKDKTN